jgi:hypothetical protein
MSEGLGIKQKYIEISILISPKLARGISCSYKCILVSYGGYVVSNVTGKSD